MLSGVGEIMMWVFWAVVTLIKEENGIPCGHNAT